MDSLSINTETGAGPIEQNQTTSGCCLAELEHIVEKGKATEEFAQEDYLRLVRVTTYTGELLSEAVYTDDQPAEAEVTA